MLFVPGIADPFYYTMEKGIQAKAKELGVTIKVAEYPKSWGPEAQVPILEAAAAAGGIDMILTAPTSTDALIAPLKKLYDQGIAIITVDTYLGDGDYTKESNYSFPLAYIGTDNKLGGQKVAEKLAEMLGSKGKVYLMNTNPDTSSVVDRGKGFTEGIAKFPDMTLVGNRLVYGCPAKGTGARNCSSSEKQGYRRYLWSKPVQCSGLLSSCCKCRSYRCC